MNARDHDHDCHDGDRRGKDTRDDQYGSGDRAQRATRTARNSNPNSCDQTSHTTVFVPFVSVHAGERRSGWVKHSRRGMSGGTRHGAPAGGGRSSDGARGWG